jgi:RND family efflux transporter MFP subunit
MSAAMTLGRCTAGVAAGLLLAGCGGSAPPLQPPEAPDLQALTVGNVVAAGGTWDGVLESAVQARVSAQTAGRVMSVEVDVDDRVRAGQALLRLSDVEQQSALRAATAQRHAAEAGLREAEARWRRSAELVARQLVSRAEHDVATAAHEAALASRDVTVAAERAAREQVEYTRVRAPFAGVVQQRLVEPGEAVGVGQPLLVVHAPGSLRVVAQLPETVAQSLRGRDHLEARRADGALVRTGPPTVFPSTDPQAHTQTVRADLPSAFAAGLQPGTTLKLLLPAALQLSATPAAAAVRVPQSAVQQRGEVSAVYVVTAQGVQLRQLRLGAQQGSEVEVLAGLVPGERVATDPVAAVGWLKAHRDARGTSDE